MDENVYLDHAGAPLPDKRMLASIFDELMQRTPLANPHAGSTMSRQTDEMIAQTRRLVLSYLNMNENDYEVVFTAGSTASIKVGGGFGSDAARSVYLMLLHTAPFYSAAAPFFCSAPLFCSVLYSTLPYPSSALYCALISILLSLHFALLCIML